MTLTTRLQAIQQQALGRAVAIPIVTAATASITAATANNGFLNFSISPNLQGTTLPNTIVGFPFVNTPSARYRHIRTSFFPITRTGWLGIFYKIGTLVLTSTGNQFTHDGATFPVLRNNLFGANTPVRLRPLVYLTAATATTAPSFILKDSGGTAGYVDQDGNSVVGTKTFTFPAAATAIQSTYLLRLEDGDSSVQDITQIDVTAAGSAGSAVIYGFEEICKVGTNLSINTINEGLLGDLNLRDMTPAVATTGTATSFLGILGGGSDNSSYCGESIAVRET